MENPTHDALTYIALLASFVSVPVVWRFVARRQRARGTWPIIAYLWASISAFAAFFAVFALGAMRDVSSIVFASFVGGVIYAGSRPKRTPAPQPVQPPSSAPPHQQIPDRSEAELDAIKVVQSRSIEAEKAAGKARKSDMEARGEHEASPLSGWSALPQPLPGPLCEIEFDYENASGGKSHRTVEVSAVDGEYFEGFCHKALANRTFVIGRILGKVVVHDTGEVLMPRKWAAQARADVRNPGVVDIGRDDRREEDDEVYEPSETCTEILFTGFSKAQRGELEALAESSGMIVRKSVTTGLSYLCAGPKAGPLKLAQAYESGVEVVDLDEFFDLLK